MDSISIDPTADEIIIFQWSRKNGDCYDCGLPAAFYRDNSPTMNDENKLCSVCAANAAADGETISRIDSDI